MSFITDSLWRMGSHVVSFVIFIVVFNIMTKGFIAPFIKAKLSRGRLVLVKCNTVTDSVYTTSEIDKDGNLKVKLGKKTHTFNKVTRDDISRELGTNFIEVDLPKGTILKRDRVKSSNYDLTIVDEMINRALMLPKLKEDDKFEKARNAILLLILLLSAVAVYLLWTQGGMTCPVPAAGGNL